MSPLPANARFVRRSRSASLIERRDGLFVSSSGVTRASDPWRGSSAKIGSPLASARSALVRMRLVKRSMSSAAATPRPSPSRTATAIVSFLFGKTGLVGTVGLSIWVSLQRGDPHLSGVDPAAEDVGDRLGRALREARVRRLRVDLEDRRLRERANRDGRELPAVSGLRRGERRLRLGGRRVDRRDRVDRLEEEQVVAEPLRFERERRRRPVLRRDQRQGADRARDHERRHPEHHELAVPQYGENLCEVHESEDGMPTGNRRIAPSSSSGPRRLLLSLYPPDGGVTRHVIDLVEGLDPERWTVDLACPPGSEPWLELSERPGVTMHPAQAREGAGAVGRRGLQAPARARRACGRRPCARVQGRLHDPARGHAARTSERDRVHAARLVVLGSRAALSRMARPRTACRALVPRDRRRVGCRTPRRPRGRCRHRVPVPGDPQRDRRGRVRPASPGGARAHRRRRPARAAEASRRRGPGTRARARAVSRGGARPGRARAARGGDGGARRRARAERPRAAADRSRGRGGSALRSSVLPADERLRGASVHGARGDGRGRARRRDARRRRSGAGGRRRDRVSLRAGRSGSGGGRGRADPRRPGRRRPTRRGRPRARSGASSGWSGWSARPWRSTTR